MRLQVLPNCQLGPGLDQESQQALRALLEGLKMLGRQGQGGLDGQRRTQGLEVGMHAHHHVSPWGGSPEALTLGVERPGIRVQRWPPTPQRPLVLPCVKCARKRNKRGASKHAFEGARELIMAWHARVRIGCTSWRTVPVLCSACLALRGALDREAPHPCCCASLTRGVR